MACLFLFKLCLLKSIKTIALVMYLLLLFFVFFLMSGDILGLFSTTNLHRFSPKFSSRISQFQLFIVTAIINSKFILWYEVLFKFYLFILVWIFSCSSTICSENYHFLMEYARKMFDQHIICLEEHSVCTQNHVCCTTLGIIIYKYQLI